MTQIKGFTGKILEIDLSTKTSKTTPLDEHLAEQFLGGAGYACASLISEITKDTDPLGPDNVMFMMSGPLLSSKGLCTGRVVACAKSPLSGIWAESNTGGQIGVQMKRAGFDGIRIRGASDHPVYLEILDDKVDIKDAGHLWGKGIEKTTEILKVEDFKHGKVAAIGPAGENLVKYAIIGCEERAFGRTGLGAVMGSKKLKAIVIKGSHNIELASPEEFKAQVKQMGETQAAVFTSQMFGALGTAGGINMYTLTGELPVKYYRTSKFDEVDNISGSTVAEKYLKKQRYCFACTIGCGRVVQLGENEENELNLPEGQFEGPEYETIAGYGSMLGNTNLKTIFKANYMCNDLGIDTISSSGVISLIMDLFNNGKTITAADLDGLTMEWGNMKNVFHLLEKIATRSGIGDVLADGSDAVGKHFNVDQDQIATIRHIEPPYHDARSTFGMAIAYGISPHYGASHCAADMYQTSLGQAHEDMDIQSIPALENSVEMAIHTARLMEYRAFFSSLNMCVFANPSASSIAKLIELGTGMPYDVERIKITGERVLSLKRLFNLKMGHSPKDEKLPKILVTPLEGAQEGKIPDQAMLFSEFYKYEEWDPITGMPSPEKLKRLNLTEYANF
ncbi:MAG: aldehyde ferredoxin oxidoreductase family protein [Promethearchaeota archaeon]